MVQKNLIYNFTFKIYYHKFMGMVGVNLNFGFALILMS